MIESHHSARLKRDYLRKKSTDAADRFEREYVRAIGKDASPMYAFHIASLTLLEDMAKKKIDSGDIDVPDGAEESIDRYRYHHRVMRENSGLPTNWDAADVTTPTNSRRLRGFLTPLTVPEGSPRLRAVPATTPMAGQV